MKAHRFPVERNASQSFLVLAALTVVCSILVGFAFSADPIETGLQASYLYAFNYAAAKRLAWGRDFVATFGPYGYILQAYDVGDIVRRRIPFSALLAVGSGLAAATYAQSVEGARPLTRLVSALVLLYSLTLQDAEYRWFVLFLLALLVAVHSSGRRALIAYAVAGGLAGFYLLVKFSLGFGALGALGLGCLLQRRSVAVAHCFAVGLCAAASTFLLGWTRYAGGAAGVRAYIATGWQLTAGYSSAMSLSSPGWQVGVLCFVLWFLLVGYWTLKHRSQRNVVSLIALVAPTFLAWKHSMVRQDAHIAIVMLFGMFVLSLLLVDTAATLRWPRAAPGAIALLIPLIIPWFIPPAAGDATGMLFGKIVTTPLRLNGLKELLRLSDLAAYHRIVADQSAHALQPDVLPDQTRKVIGLSSVDVYPSEIAFVAANGLLWANRPLPASFSSYTPVLDGLNAAFFSSAGRPKFLLWHGVDSIDGRHLFWDEPRTLRTILSYYDAVETDSLTLMRARSEPRFSTPLLIGTVEAHWNHWIPVPDGRGVILAAVSAEQSIVRSLVRAVFRESAVYLSLRFASGEEATYRVVPDNMVDGLWVSPFATTIDELRSVLREGPGRKVAAIRFTGGTATGDSDRVKISWLLLRAINRPETKPPANPSLPPPTRDRPCAGYVDRVVKGVDWYGREGILAVGWARDGNRPVAASRLQLVDGDNRLLSARIYTGLHRPDVAKTLAMPGLETSGWWATAAAPVATAPIGFAVRTQNGEVVLSCNKRRE